MTEEMRDQRQPETVEPVVNTDELPEEDLNNVAGGLNFTKITYDLRQTDITDGTSNTIMFGEKQG